MMRYCTRCVMDTTDPNITFNPDGVCHHCLRYDASQQYWQEKAPQLPALIDAIKQAGQGKPYDCITGISGGIDSSFLLYSAVATYHLRPYVFHVDNG